MRVVSNTSPLSNLAIIGRLDFLPRRYGAVQIPPGVAAELAALSHPAGSRRITLAMTEGWLQISPPPPVIPTLPFPLDAGETEAIALACQVKAEVLLMDEKRGREAARRCGLVVAGVLGELIQGKQAGWIPNVREEIQRLRRDAGFFVDGTVERFILSQVGG